MVYFSSLEHRENPRAVTQNTRRAQAPPSASSELRSEEGIPYWLLLSALFGLCATWCDHGVNRPMLTEVVAPKHRARREGGGGGREGRFRAWGSAAFRYFIGGHCYFNWRLSLFHWVCFGMFGCAATWFSLN